MHRINKHSIYTQACHSSKVHCVRWSPDGSKIASSGQDRTVRLHRLVDASLSQDLTFKGHSDEIDQLCWNPTNPNVLATASLDKTVKIWDVRYNDTCTTVKLKNDNMSICWSADGSTVAVSDKADVLTFLDASYSFKIIKDQAFRFEIGEIAWNKEKDLFFLTSADGKIHVLSYPDLQTVVVIDAFSSACICIQFDQSGKYFAVGSNDAIASIWDLENLACIQTVSRPDWPVRAVSFSHDGMYLASGSEDSFIDIANVKSGEQVYAVSTSSPTLTLDFHPKDYLLAFAMDELNRDEDLIKIANVRPAN